ncbi:hypothetical protein [Shigella phage ESh25]|nr:hypothetical protein [Shigella phage ESh25]
MISLISPEKGLSSSEFNERLDKITNKLNAVLDKKD